MWSKFSCRLIPKSAVQVMRSDIASMKCKPPIHLNEYEGTQKDGDSTLNGRHEYRLNVVALAAFEREVQSWYSQRQPKKGECSESVLDPS